MQNFKDTKTICSDFLPSKSLGNFFQNNKDELDMMEEHTETSKPD